MASVAARKWRERRKSAAAMAWRPHLHLFPCVPVVTPLLLPRTLPLPATFAVDCTVHFVTDVTRVPRLFTSWRDVVLLPALCHSTGMCDTAYRPTFAYTVTTRATHLPMPDLVC